MASNTSQDEVPADKWSLRLYTAGQTPKSLAAIRNLKKVCEDLSDTNRTLVGMDLLPRQEK
jgi:circadian clock protein KaiB